MRKLFGKGTMISRHPFGAKIVAYALAVMMVVTMLPASAFAQTKAAESGKVTDYSTINEWKEHFVNSDGIDTEYAGGVWTDKSVFENGDALNAALDRREAKTNITMKDDDNFIVTMSALGTNKEIVGYSTIPTDTIFVLDVSNSMDTAGSVPTMIGAVNDAIKRLLELNKNNRIGVVLYSGNSNVGNSNSDTGKVLLELGRYQAGKNGEYITYTGTQKDTTVVTAERLKKEDGTTVSENKKTTNGGTYMQNGIYIAMQQFLKADTVIEDGNIQEGESRIPIFVLMGDGAPTAGNTAYTGDGATSNGVKQFGTSDLGDGTATSAGHGFLTQLTAAHARKATKAHYNNVEPKFYTLGLNLHGSEGEAVANSVMNPSQSINAIDSYWDNLFRDGSVKISGAKNEEKTVKRPTENGSAVYTDKLERSDQNYVDKYFDASSNEKLEDAFGDIVAEIILQSAYYPTYIENGNRDLGGYVKFHDDIGHFMEVKEVEGILLGNKMFTGETLAYMMKQGEFGSGNKYTDEGWELVESVAERIGVDESSAIALLQNAWNDKQLYYDDATHYSNYIGWYEGANGEYLGFWSQSDSDEDMQAAAANGAVYVTKSYGYYGDENESGIVGSDMMHVVVKVRTNISTGQQGILFEIPASLIPLITYDITLDADSYDKAKNITMEVSEDTPIRLLLEVGLKDEVTEYNLQEMMSGEDVHKHPILDANGNETGEYYFYTNVWGYGQDEEGITPHHHEVAESKFIPSTDNERYYYIEDTVIYEKNGAGEYVAYTGEEYPTGEGYYRAYRTFKMTGTGNNAKMTYVYEDISPETLALGDETVKDENGKWYIKKGTVRRTLDSYRIEKVNNGIQGGPTETLRYSRYAVMEPSETIADYAIYSFLGNNGRIKMTPATGIKLTKQVDSTINAKNTEYEFKIKLENNSINGEYKLYKNNAESAITFTNGESNVKLKAGETVYISGLPTVNYSITEVVPDGAGYKVVAVTVDGVAEDSDKADDTIETHKLDSVVFTNTESKEGDLIVRKNVVSDYPESIDKVNNLDFAINVQLTNASGNPLPEGTIFNTIQDGEDGTVTLDKNGSFTVQLKHNESITVKDVHDGTKYTVTESTLPKGFELGTPESDLTGSIVTDETKVVTVVNNYKPEGAPAIKVNMTKSMTGRDWTGTDSFGFRLEKMNADGSWEAISDKATVTQKNKGASFVIPSSELNAVGTYYFRVLETNPNAIPGIISDAARYFSVTVTETKGDGQLEIKGITGENITANTDKTMVEMQFTNKYVTDGEATVSIPVEKHMSNSTGVVVPLSGYRFELYDSNGKMVDANGTAAGKAIETNVAGEAVIHLTYTGTRFDELKDNNNQVVLNYTLKEVVPDSGVPNVEYSTQVYNITVTLKSEGGKLISDVVIKEAAGTGESMGAAVFTNTFRITDNAKATFDFKAYKDLQGRTLKDREFNFSMYEAGADFVVTKPEAAATGTNNGNVVDFTDISYSEAGTYYYVVKEDVPTDKKGVAYSNEEYYVTVHVIYDESMGKLVTNKEVVKPGTGIIEDESDIVFHNEYSVAPTSLVLKGTKILTGKDIASGDFSFEVLDQSGQKVAEAKSGHAIANADGVATSTFSFTPIEYTAAGEYTYTVKEINSGKAGYTYDRTVYSIVVTVTDNGEGELTATVDTNSSTGIVFNNTYDPEPTEINLNAFKHMENLPLYAGDFEFGVYSTDASFDENTGTRIGIKGNAADGTVTFDAIIIDKPGTYRYVVKEEIPASKNPNISYDDIEYYVTAVVWDAGGELASRVTYTANGVPATQMYFSNIYFEPTPVSVDLIGTKKLDGRHLNAKEFTFELYETGADYSIEGLDPKETVQNGEFADLDESLIVFKTLTYDVDDLEGVTEKTFHYVIKEAVPAANDDRKGITYDDSYFTMDVKVTNSGVGLLEVTKTITEVDGSDEDTAVDGNIEFNNTYKADSAKLSLGGTKTLTNKNLSGDDFSFSLYRTGEDYSTDGVTAEQTVTNSAEGTFTFSDLTFDAEGTYYFAVAENAGDNDGAEDGQVDYDDTKYQIEVVVSDNGNGELEIDAAYNGDKRLTDQTEAEITDLNFSNGYNPIDAVLNLEGYKTLTGRDITLGEFNFELYETGSDYKVDESDEPIQTKAIGQDEYGNYKFAFDSIVFDTMDVNATATHYYVVKEQIPEDKYGVDYDTTEYQIKVVASNDGAGAIDQVVTFEGEDFTGETVTIDALNFTNSYEAKLPADAGLVITGQKKISGDRNTVSAGEFTFLLSEMVDLDGKEIASEPIEAKAGAGGAFVFDKISTYDKPGTYKYRVTEKVGTVEGMTYDKTVYDVTVEVSDNGKGDLVVEEPVIEVNGQLVKDVEFNNVYDDPAKVVPPADGSPVQTGDGFSLSLYVLLMMMAITGMAAATVRRKTN